MDTREVPPPAGHNWERHGNTRGPGQGVRQEKLHRFQADICLWLPASLHLQHYIDKAWLLHFGSGVLE